MLAVLEGPGPGVATCAIVVMYCIVVLSLVGPPCIVVGIPSKSMTSTFPLYAGLSSE